MKLSNLRILAFLLAGFAAATGFAGAKHVVLIGVDGCGSRWIPWDKMPNLAALRDEGLYTTARCHRPTASAINWKSVFSGIPPEIHGYNKWNSKASDIEPPAISLDSAGRIPCIFSEVRRQMPQARTASFFTWDGIGFCHNTNCVGVVRQFNSKREWCGANGPVETGVEYPERDAAVFDAGVAELENEPVLMLLYQGQVDSNGHKFGWGSPEFIAACERVDANIGKFMAALKAKDMWRDTIVMFVADHGGLDKGHGGKEDIRVFEVPFIVSGPAARHLRLKEPAMLEDVSPTIAAALGLEIPETWRGRPACVEIRD